MRGTADPQNVDFELPKKLNFDLLLDTIKEGGREFFGDTSHEP
jgi:hypothetical protein